ncbi:transcription initiation factor IIA gamma subunit [Mycena metata]|uniref:Transcription initiation factor IIA subunit 2 n=1 Tax=Mycena metata TaxID=1033252 RepID=A0AAD7JJ89_9AGAR|nr:transcription initiation factor IIA gamma subunit [Mycena metata]
MASAYFEIYRGSPLGIALMDTIDEYVRAKVLDGTQGIRILQVFDRALGDALARKVAAKASVKARMKTYNHNMDVLNLDLRDATFKMDDKESVTVARIKLIACKRPDAGESAPVQRSRH